MVVRRYLAVNGERKRKGDESERKGANDRALKVKKQKTRTINLQRRAKVLDGGRDDGVEDSTPVTHLHHTHTRSLVIEKVSLCLLQHLHGEGRGASREVEHTVSHNDEQQIGKKRESKYVYEI